MGFKESSCSLMASRYAFVWKDCFLGEEKPYITEVCQKETKASLTPQLLPPSKPDKSYTNTEPPRQHFSQRSPLLYFSIPQGYSPGTEMRNSPSKHLATFGSKYVFFFFNIRFAHQFASQWDECFSFLLRRKYQLFIATRGNNEWLQEPLDSMSPRKQIYKQSFSTTVLQDAKDDWARSFLKTF